MTEHPPWDDSYRGDEPAPWDIGRPQPAFERLSLVGTVLDAGCGTGEHARMAAARGHEVLGIDIAPTAIARAREKVPGAEFVVADALQLESLGRRFDTVLDCGLFHTLREPADRARYVAGLGAVCRGTVHILCFRDAEPRGPHPVSESELRDAFASGWHVDSLEPTTLETHFGDCAAWLASVSRV